MTEKSKKLQVRNVKSTNAQNCYESLPSSPRVQQRFVQIRMPFDYVDRQAAKEMSKESKCCGDKYAPHWLASALLIMRNGVSKLERNFKAKALCHTDNLIVDAGLVSSISDEGLVSQDTCDAPRQKRRRRKTQKKKGRDKSKKRKETRRRNDRDSSQSSSDDSASPQRPTSVVEVGLLRYTFYLVLNMGFPMDRGYAAAVLCRGFMSLYTKLEYSSATSLEEWEKTGLKILVLKGCDHRHLHFLEKEVRYLAIASHSLSRTWGRRQIILVLTAFGREMELEEVFEGLTLLR